MSISLFLGAGASAQFGMNTTRELKSKMSQDSKINPTTQNQSKTKTMINSLLENPNFKDIEEILHAIKQLNQNITNPSDFQKYAKLAWEYLINPSNPGFKNIHESLSNQLIDIENQINDYVFNSYKWDNAQDAALKLFYTKLFQIIFDGSKTINIGTTNYDQAIERFCRLPNSKFSCHDGFDMSKSNSESIFSSSNFNLKNTDPEKMDIRLFKIHGSLNWMESDGRIKKKFGDKFTIEKQNRMFISPTLDPKIDAKKEPFSTLNSLFNHHLQDSSSICVIIGYSFRDKHINERFEQFLKSSKKHIVLISPNCKSDFVRHYKNQNFDTEDKDDAWLKSNKPKNVHFLEYRVSSNNQTVFDELSSRLDRISVKSDN